MLDDLCILVLFLMILEGYYRLSYPDLKLHSVEIFGLQCTAETILIKN